MKALSPHLLIFCMFCALFTSIEARINQAASAGRFDEESSECSLCLGGREPNLPKKNVSSLLLHYMEGRSSIEWPRFGGTCLEVDKNAREFLSLDSSECQAVHSVSGICGCPERRNSCSTECSEVGFPERIVEAPEYKIPPMSCKDLLLHATIFSSDSEDCTNMTSLFDDRCECLDRKYPVFHDETSPPLGRDTNRTRPPSSEKDESPPSPPPRQQDSLLSAKQKNKALAWIPRATGILSALGSLFIIWDVCKGCKSQSVTVYQELMLSISIFDVISSIAWAFSTLPIPEEDKDGEPTGIYGARGNEATCTAQGFFKQLGFTAIWYNLTLSIYYLLVIRNGVREARIRKFSKWFHLPLLIGFGLAFAGIPFYDYDVWACYIPPPPLSPNFWAISIFLIVPVSVVIVVATVNMVLVYLSVRKQDAIGEKWRFRSSASAQATPNRSVTVKDTGRVGLSEVSSRRSRTLERNVFWQCSLYLGAFYLTWPILIVSQFMAEQAEVGFGFWAMVFALAPAQGFWNFIVYVRPRLQQHMNRRRLERERLSSRLSSSMEQGRSNRESPTYQRTDTKTAPSDQIRLDTVHEDDQEECEGATDC